MTVQERKNTLIALGERLKNLSEAEFTELSLRAINQNNWFTATNIKTAIQAWASSLAPDKVEQWTRDLLEVSTAKSVGLIMAGNIPMVGMHDLLAVLVSGHKAAIKLSSQDSALIQFVINEICLISPQLGEQIELVEQLKEAEAVIATGSDNTARYFKQYFGNKPHIIRQNRTSIAVLNGQESVESLAQLGKDIFTYYGLGCRNVAKVFVPKGMDLAKFIDGLLSFESVIEHHKYRNNYDYNKSIYLVNGEPHLDSGFFLMRETEDLVSPISVIFYEQYDNEAQLALKLSTISEKTQCIVSCESWYPNSFDFGQAQSPELWDYADGVNTLEFLTSLD